MRYVFAALVVLCTAAPSMAAADLTLAAGVTVAPGETAALALVLTTPAPAGGVSVSLSSSDTAKVKVNPENVYIPGGSTTSPSQPRVTGVAFGSATISASAYGLIGTSTTVQVSSQLSGPASQTIQRGS